MMSSIEEIRVSAYEIPTDSPESDGTLKWDSTTLILVEASAGGETGIGYTYSHAAAGVLIRDVLADQVVGLNAMDISMAWSVMRQQVRNLGHCGIAAMSISAVDNCLWDLKAKLLGLPLVRLLGQVRDGMQIYGSGGFTSYGDRQLSEQFGGWAAQGISRVKMKVGRNPDVDSHRVAVAREAIGAETELFVDANSAYDRKQALYFMDRFAAYWDIRWMEQPLAPEDHAGMRFLRESSPSRVEVTDGEYAWGPEDIREMLDAEAVDVVMADATRCGGITGFMRIADLCDARRMPLSSHCAPLLHLHPGCAAPPLRHAEFFHDHVRIEKMLFDGFPELRDGMLVPDLSAPGLGVNFKFADAERFRIAI